jgi:hypothetical protein
MVDGLENQDPAKVESEINEGTSSQSVEKSIAEEGQYTPNYKFKVMDDELEFDEKIRSVITSKEQEEHLRDLYTKAHGVPKLKETIDKKSKDYEDITGRYSTVEAEYNQLREGIDKLGHLSKKDFGLFQKSMSINDDAILDRAAEILEYRRADTDEQRRLDQIQQDKLRGYQSQNEAEYYRKQNDEFRQFKIQYELDQAIVSPEISEFAKQFDSKMGGDAFKRKVAAYGASVWNQSRQYIAPLEACRAIASEYKVFFNEQNPASSNPNPTVSREAPKPIPNLGTGTSVSPTKRKFKSIDDIRKLSEQMDRERASQYQ